MSEEKDLSELSGVEYLQWVMEREANGETPAISSFLGMNLVEAEAGRVVVDLTTSPNFLNTQGTVHAGIITTLLDTVMGRSIMTMLPGGTPFTTVDLQVHFIRPVSAYGIRVIGEGKTIRVGRRIATSSGEIRDEDGKLLAFSTCNCLVLKEN